MRIEYRLLRWASVVAPLMTATGGAAAESPYRVIHGHAAHDYRLTNAAAYRMNAGRGPDPRVSRAAAELAAMPFAREVEAAARRSSLDAALVHAVIHVESRHRPKAVSPKGAIGLMQVLPGTAARYGIADPGRSPRVNLRAGTLYLRDLMDLFGPRLDLVLAAYNAGEGAVMRHAMKIPPYPETRRYVQDVLAKYRSWGGTHGMQEPPPLPSRIEYLPGTRLRAACCPA
jgi:soluble lytic murein transglycosylase-like protein